MGGRLGDARAGKRGGQRLGAGLRVGDHREVRLVDLADFPRIDVDVDELFAVEKRGVESEGRVLREGITHRDDEVRGLERLPGAPVAGGGEYTEAKLVIFRNDALAVERGSEGDLEPLGEIL